MSGMLQGMVVMRAIKTLFFVALVSVASAAHAQKATEMFIPIGKSPGLSGKHTSIGTVEAVDARAETITLAVDGGTRVIHCTKTTKFWLDRSPLRRSNGVGALEDCLAGTRIEIKYVDSDRSDAVAEWVKIEVTDSD